MNARDTLRQAISDKHNADAEVLASRDALQRAKTLVDSVDAELAGFDASENVNAVGLLENIKAAIRAGREVIIPEMNSARSVERVRLDERRKKALRAWEDLAKDLQFAQERAATANKNLHRAALGVVKEEAAQVAGQTRAAQDYLWSLNALLSSAAGLWVAMPGESNKLISLPPDVVLTLSRSEPQYIASRNPLAVSGQIWRDFLKDLLDSADVPFPHVELLGAE